MTKWQLSFHFLFDVLKYHTKLNKFFWSDALFRNWRNDCIVTKWKFNFPFLSSFNPWVWNHHLDISVAISGYIWSSQAKTSSVIAIWNFFGLTDRHERVLEELSLLKKFGWVLTSNIRDRDMVLSCHYSETWTNVAGTNVVLSNVPEIVASKYR